MGLITPRVRDFTKMSSVVGALTPVIDGAGLTAKVQLNEAVVAGDLLYFNTSAKKFAKARANNAATLPAVCMALEDGAANAFIDALFHGTLKSFTLGEQNRASGTVTISGTVSNGDFVELNGVYYEFNANKANVTAGRVWVDISGGATASAAQAALVAALTSDTLATFSFSAWVSNVMTVYAKYPAYKGTAGNALTLSKSGTNIAVSGANLAGGNDGGVLYVSAATAGKVTYTAPGAGNRVQIVGVCPAADLIIFSPDKIHIAGT